LRTCVNPASSRGEAPALVSRGVQRLKDQVSRQNDILTELPVFVRALGEDLPRSAPPAIAIRYAKKVFRASKVGFFVPVKGEEALTLHEGYGFPPEWKGTIRISPADGILGESIRNRMVITRTEYLHGRRHWNLGLSTLEEHGITPEVIAPVPVSWPGKPFGVLVIADCDPLEGTERRYATMVSDLLASAIRKGMERESLEYKATIDSLTLVSNRRHFDAWFMNELTRARSYRLPLSLALIDIDHFKNVNDAYGHPCGDNVLQQVAAVIRRNTRSSDLVARYGGEEFAVVIPSADKKQALVYAENIRRVVEELRIEMPGHTVPISVTVSMGISEFPQDGETMKELLEAADIALYEAKTGGRNRTAAASRSLLAEDLSVDPT
jgi:diguanylate cyclase (GGDEF)-like protein